MSAKKPWLITGVLGLVVTGLGLSVMKFFPAEGHAIDPGYGGPVFAFEMAKSAEDLEAVFGPESDPQRAARIAAMDRGNWWDFAFMAAYSLYMAAFAFAIYRQNDRPIWLVVVAVGLLAGFADAVENVILLDITRDLGATSNLDWLGWPVWTKFLSIMVCVCAAGFFVASQKKVAWRILGVVTVLGGLAIGIAFTEPSEYGWMIRGGTTVSWVVMLVYSWFQILPAAATAET